MVLLAILPLLVFGPNAWCQPSIQETLIRRLQEQIENLSDQRIIQIENVQREFGEYFHLAKSHGVPVDRWIQLRGRDHRTEAFLANDGILNYLERQLPESTALEGLRERLLPISALKNNLGKGTLPSWFIVEHQWEHLHAVVSRGKTEKPQFLILESGPWDHGHGWNHATLRAIRDVYPEAPVYIFKYARQRDQYSCRAMLLLDLEVHFQENVWDLVDKVSALRPEWVEPKGDGFLVLRWHPPQMMRVSQSLKFLETYLKSEEVQQFFGGEALGQLDSIVHQHMRVIYFSGEPKKCNFFLSQRLMEQLIGCVLDLLEKYPIQ
jgi:hypothetical protein